MNITSLLESLPERTYEGASAGNMVKVTITNRLEVVSVDIDPEHFTEGRRYLIEEMLASVYNDLIARVLEDVSAALEREMREKFTFPDTFPSPDAMQKMMRESGVGLDFSNPKTREAIETLAKSMFGAGPTSVGDTDDDESETADK